MVEFLTTEEWNEIIDDLANQLLKAHQVGKSLRIREDLPITTRQIYSHLHELNTALKAMNYTGSIRLSDNAIFLFDKE